MRRTLLAPLCLLLAVPAALVPACSPELIEEGPEGPNGPGATSGRGDLPADDTGTPGSALGVSALENAGAGTDWHPDPDGDGVKTGVDKCPYVYDPAQTDGDGDGIGDACDNDVDAPSAGSPINDLRAEHVTPYGAWFTFRSNESSEYGFRAEIAWSEKRSDVESKGAFDATRKRGDGTSVSCDEHVGVRIPAPAIAMSLKPGTKYFAAVLDNQGRVGKPLEFTTLPAPPIKPSATFPRVFATRPLLDEIRRRAAGNDAAWTKWKTEVTSRVDAAVNDTTPDNHEFKYCEAAALMFHAGDASMLAKAKRLHANLIPIWEGAVMSGNAYRWSDAALGMCTDLLWNELDAATRERALKAVVRQDEPHAKYPGDDFRLDDTDESIAFPRAWILNGLLACQAPGISKDVSDRACKVRDFGLRYWFGFDAVLTRRDRGFLAQSGGHMPDSTSYHPGSSTYWAQSIWALHNAGIPASDYGPWIVHNMAATYIHPLTPKMRGLATWGDIDRYMLTKDAEPNSMAFVEGHPEMAAMHIGLLRASGRDKEAAYARFFLPKVTTPNVETNRVPLMLFDTAALAAVDPRATISTAYLDSGFGLFYDRTTWSENASMLTFHAGWTGVDHVHEDQGHFQLYRKGRWLTHESIAYSYTGTAPRVDGHNVLALDVKYNDGKSRPGQFFQRNVAQPRMFRTSAGARHTYAHSELTGAYQSGQYNSYNYDAVQRALVWLKGDEKAGADTLVVYDVVDTAAAAAGKVTRQFQAHFDAAPIIDGRHAFLDLPATAAGDVRQRIDVNVLLPATAALAAKAPEGAPGNDSGAVYTHRLIVDPKTNEAKLRFLTTISGSDGANVPATLAADDAAFVGARVGDAVVVFPRNAILAKGAPVAQSVSIAGGGPARVFWTGHVPGAAYAIAATAEGGRLKLSATPGGALKADRGGVLAIDVSASNGVAALYR